MSTVAFGTTFPTRARRMSSSTPVARATGSSPEARTRLHLTRRGRVVLTGLAALPLVAGAFLLSLNAGMAEAGGAGAGQSFEYVTVQSGQSLWQLAEQLAPSADPRDVIADIVSLNQLASTDIEPGQRLAIPAQY
ncbi:LysM peptidoglycan-binding domain-containing protein [Rathayibacter sp. YIM 133350]|uniref:LysM peptidoglycan-binding domain-containing protein n=1 Tax=Rathayibacter sp. YIM 133350 TaxID=3131992 RepID=UPI00307F83B8